MSQTDGVWRVPEGLKAFARTVRDDYWYPFLLGAVLVVIGRGIASIEDGTWEGAFLFVLFTCLFGGAILFSFRLKQWDIERLQQKRKGLQQRLEELRQQRQGSRRCPTTREDR